MMTGSNLQGDSSNGHVPCVACWGTCYRKVIGLLWTRCRLEDSDDAMRPAHKCIHPPCLYRPSGQQTLTERAEQELMDLTVCDNDDHDEEHSAGAAALPDMMSGRYGGGQETGACRGGASFSRRQPLAISDQLACQQREVCAYLVSCMMHGAFCMRCMLWCTCTVPSTNGCSTSSTRRSGAAQRSSWRRCEGSPACSWQRRASPSICCARPSLPEPALH